MTQDPQPFTLMPERRALVRSGCARCRMMGRSRGAQPELSMQEQARGSMAKGRAARRTDPALPAGLADRTASWIGGQIAALYPGCFALVMATGIISNAFFLEERRAISDALLLVNLVAYPWLIVATALRMARFRQRLWDDLVDPRLVFSFFTIVAASDVFGLQLELRGFGTAALALWLLALIVWFLLIYLSFGVLTFLNTWAWATWWIPLLLLFGVWKHGVCRVPVTYTPMFWSLVFPLGMYALASLRLSLAADFPPLRTLSLAMAWLALAAWAATAAGLVVASWRSFRELP
jgi:tellurite resistance protein TehA-like permease